MKKDSGGVISVSRKTELKVRKVSSLVLGEARKDKVLMFPQAGHGHGGEEEEEEDSFGSKLLE